MSGGRVLRRAVPAAAAVLALVPATAVLAVPYNAGREALTNHLDHVAHAAALVDTDSAVERMISGTRVLIMPSSGTLADLRRRFPQAVQREPRGVWKVTETIVVTHGATLTIAVPTVRELLLSDGAHAFTDIVGWGSNVRFVGSRGDHLRVRSWDVRTRRPDVTLENGRGSVQTREGGRIDAAWTAFSHLGFYAGRVSGVAVVSRYGQPRGGGTLAHSTFAGNFFGAYSYNAEGMRFIDDRFTGNVIYGLDPHDNSDDFVVRGDYAAHNGLHGIIFSRFCDHNLIVDNVSELNGWHGIVLDDGKSADGPSDENVVAHNLVRANGLVGVSIDGSDRNVVSDNVIVGGDQGIRIYGPASGDRLEDNTIRHPRSFGILLDHPSRATTVEGNTVTAASDGIRIRDAPDSVVADNTINAARQHGVKIDGFSGRDPAGVRVRGNAVTGVGPSPFGVQPGPISGIALSRNPNSWTYPVAHRLARILGWFVGPGAWVLLFATVALGGRWLAVRTRITGRRPRPPRREGVGEPSPHRMVIDGRPRRARPADRMGRTVSPMEFGARASGAPMPPDGVQETPADALPTAQRLTRSLAWLLGVGSWITLVTAILLGGPLAALGERVISGRSRSRVDGE
jgi:parallel beta-helix repeat protein